jgi:hypothetical protein
LVARTRAAELDARLFLQQRDEANTELEITGVALSAFRSLFPKARSAHDVWCLYHSMEGRALAGEAILAVAARMDPALIQRATLEVTDPPKVQ